MSKRDDQSLPFNPGAHCNQFHRFQWSVLAPVVLSAAGCALVPQAVPVKPDVQVQQSTAGQGRAVMVSVDDGRSKTTLGQRGPSAGADLTVEGDLPTTIRSALIDGLQRQGFAPGTTNTSDNRELRVEIRNLDYQVTTGFYSVKTHMGCVLKATCVIGSARPYEHLYRAEQAEGSAFIKTEAGNTKFVNDVVSKSVNDLLLDEGLTKCLAQ